MTNVTAFPGAKATDTLVPNTIKVTIGTGEDAREITIATFCLSKTIQTFALMTELAQAAGLSEAVAAADGSAAAGEFENQTAPSFVRKALAILPVALHNGQPALYRLLGLLVTPNNQLRRMDENDEDIQGYLLKVGKDIAYSATNDQIVSLVIGTVQVMGVESIVKNLPKLAGLMSSVRS